MKDEFETRAEGKGEQGQAATQPAGSNTVAQRIIKQRLWQQTVNRHLGRRLGKI